MSVAVDEREPKCTMFDHDISTPLARRALVLVAGALAASNLLPEAHKPPLLPKSRRFMGVPSASSTSTSLRPSRRLSAIDSSTCKIRSEVGKSLVPSSPLSPRS